MSEDVAKVYAKGIQADIASANSAAEAFTNAVYDAAEGKESFDTMAAWAAESMTDAQLTAYNKGISSGDPDLAAMAVSTLKGLYVAANGSAPKLVQGDTPQQTTTGVYANMREAAKDKADPRYGKDKAFTDAVHQKLAASDI